MLLQLFFVTALAAAIAYTWRGERTGRIRRSTSVFWTLLWVAAGIVVVWPEVASRFASAVGIGRGADAIVYVAVAFLYYLVFRLVLKQRRLESNVSDLVREIALRDLERDNMKKDDVRN